LHEFGHGVLHLLRHVEHALGLGEDPAHLGFVLGGGAVDLLEDALGPVGHGHALLDLFQARHHRGGGAVHALEDVLDELSDVGRGLAGLFGEFPDFGGDDGEAFASLAGLRRLDARVDGEEVGLGGDVFNENDDLIDLHDVVVQAADHRGRALRILSEGLHGGLGLADDFVTRPGRALGFPRRVDAHRCLVLHPGDGLDQFLNKPVGPRQLRHLVGAACEEELHGGADLVDGLGVLGGAGRQVFAHAEEMVRLTASIMPRRLTGSEL
jgi:hypothetical protein